MRKKRGLITNGYCVPYNPKLTERAKELRNSMTSAEEKIWEEFVKHYKYRVRRQKQIDNYIVDFYCAKLKLAIEIDGAVHNTEDAAEYDCERTKVIGSYGIRLVRFTNDEVLNNFEQVCKRLDSIE